MRGSPALDCRLGRYAGHRHPLACLRLLESMLNEYLDLPIFDMKTAVNILNWRFLQKY